MVISRGCLCPVIGPCFISSSIFFFFKQKTAYEMRISDWSSDLCSSDLLTPAAETAMRDYLRKNRGDRYGKFKYSTQLLTDIGELGRASCRERVCQYV